MNDALGALLAQSAAFRFIIHPAMVLGGVFFAIGLNVISTFRVVLRLQNGTVVTTMTTRSRLFNSGVLVVNFFLLVAIVLDAFGGNFQIVPR